MQKMIMNMNTSSLKVYLTETTKVNVREENAEYTLLSAEEEEKRLMEFGSLLLQRQLEEGGEEGEDEEEESQFKEEEEEKTPLTPAHPPGGGAGGGLLWQPKFPQTSFSSDFSWFWTIFYRVNAAHLIPLHTKDLIARHKIAMFKNAHVQLCQFIDALDVPPTNDVLEPHLASLWQGLGISRFSSDRSLITVQHRDFVLRKTPLEVIREAYPDLLWTPEEVAAAGVVKEPLRIDGEWKPMEEWPPLETHRLFYGVIFILNQCRELAPSPPSPPSARSAEGGELPFNLWLYYTSFVDFFHHLAPRFDDAFLMTPMGSEMSRTGEMQSSEKLTPWQMYGTLDTRTFSACDLPDLYHVLASLPLSNEQKVPGYFLGKVYQKALPFACHRRHLILLVIKCMNESEQFARLVMRLAWCMLANLYPGDLYFEEYPLKMRDLLRIKELTSNKEMLLKALHVPDNGGPLVILTMFRMHILYMVSFNKDSYVPYAKQHIDWDGYEKEIIKLRNIICSYSMYNDDPFVIARKELGKTVKSPHAKVHRLRKKSIAVNVMAVMNDTLEKLILKDKQNFGKDLQTLLAGGQQSLQQTHIGSHLLAHDPSNATVEAAIEICRDAKRFYDKLLALDKKAAILNRLLDFPAAERLSQNAFCILMEPELGGISNECVHTMLQLIKLFEANSPPKEVKRMVGTIKLVDFVTVCFYINMVTQLDRISFIKLPYEVVKQTDKAMIYRHGILPGQKVAKQMFDISVSLCCLKICTLMGQNKNGDHKVTYNLETQMFQCVYGKAHQTKQKKQAEKLKLQEEEAEDEEEGEEEDVHDEAGDVLAAEEAQAQEAQAEDEMDLLLRGYVSAPPAPGGGGLGRGGPKKRQKSQVVQDRKAVRNERKQFNKIPCGQPVLSFSLRGRALVWSVTHEKKQIYMFCPKCASLHLFSRMNMAGEYKCTECARKEMMHLKYFACCYCGRSTPSQINETLRLTVWDDYLVKEQLYFCKAHFRIAKFHNLTLDKKRLFEKIRKVQQQKQLQYAKGIYKK